MPRLRYLPLVCVLLAGPAHAQGLGEAFRACQRGFQSATDRLHNFEDCGIRLFSARPVRPALGMLPPQNGLGAGIHIERDFATARGDQHVAFLEGILAPGGAWQARGRLQFSWKPDTFSSGPNYVLDLTAAALDAGRIDYYGIGPATPAVRTPYRYRAFTANIEGRIPLGGALTIGGGPGMLAPQLKGNADAAPLSLTRTEQDTPGLTRQPTYLTARVFASVHDPDDPDSPAWEYTASYTWWHADQPYAFARFVAEARHDVGIAGGNLLLHGVATTTHTDAADVVPFYLQETLGGTNLRGESTIRGLDDYRYRGPHTVLLQAEYRHMLWDPLGIATFYDTGTVARADGTISTNMFKHSYGIGLTISIPTAVVFRVYLARAGSTTHPFVGIMDGL